jgi:glycosyltransferase involved in cell wall biosynthesis
MSFADEWPQVAVIVPTYDRPDRLEATVESLDERFDRTRVHRRSNTGPAAARNHGWRSISPPNYVSFSERCTLEVSRQPLWLRVSSDPSRDTCN